MKLIKTAGLTNGAFYGHFGSKEALVASACGRVLSSTLDTWTALSEAGPCDRSEALARFLGDHYSPEHLLQHDNGCLFATMSGEIARQPTAVRRSFTESLKLRIRLWSTFSPVPQSAANNGRWRRWRR